MHHLFQHLGFTDKEELVYTTLLQLGPTAASTLARLTKLKRTSMYDILAALTARNLILTIKQGHTTFYAVDDLNKLVHLEKDRLRSAENLVQQLKNLPAAGQSMQIHYYRGVEGFREMYEDILRAPSEELMAWVNLDTFYSGLDMRREAEWTAERVRQKKFARLLLVNSPAAQVFKAQDKANYRETKILDDQLTFAPSCFLYNGYVTFFSSTAPMVGIRICSQELYSMHQNLFNGQWNQR